MEYKVLYRKYRPSSFDGLVGQEYTVRLLKNAIQEKKLSHAYIFTGPRGTGKTSTAKIFAKAINCLNPNDGNPCNECEMCKNFDSNPDIVEIDAASNNGVDDVREIINNIKLAPAMSNYKVYIIDEFHMLSISAFNALLLTLEEPPQNVVFILATTDIQSVPITVLSRCQRFDFRPITLNVMVSRLKEIAVLEKIDITDEAIREIAILAKGGLRDGLSLLDQVSANNSKVTLDDITTNFGIVSDQKVNKIFELLEANELNNFIKLIEEFKKDGVDADTLIEKIIDKAKHILIEIKLSTYNGNLLFDNLYDIIFDLNTIFTGQNVNLDIYEMLEIVFIKYFSNEKNLDLSTSKIEIKKDDKYFPGNKSNDGNNQNEGEFELKNIKYDNNNLVNNHISTNSQLNLQNENINSDLNRNYEKYNPGNNEISETNDKFAQKTKIRINNCFVNAKKTYLNLIKEKWNDFIIYESNANKKIMAFIMDTDIVAASDRYAILVNKIDSSNDLINENIDSLENDFKMFYGTIYNLVSISPKRWEYEKESFKNNLQNSVKYIIMEENNDMPETNGNSELEKMAEEIFGNKVEIK